MSVKLDLISRINWQLKGNAYLASTLRHNEEEGLTRLTGWMYPTQGYYSYREVDEIVRQRYREKKLEDLLDEET